MFGTPLTKISTPLIQEIEEAVLLGHTRELGGVLDIISSDGQFPDNLRYALESLFYFRSYYGKNGQLEPRDLAAKQTVVKIENLWGREIIEMIGHAPDMTEAKYA